MEQTSSLEGFPLDTQSIGGLSLVENKDRQRRVLKDLYIQKNVGWKDQKDNHQTKRTQETKKGLQELARQAIEGLRPERPQ